ncbi:signal peptidase I [Neisseria weixii]|uniref:signal peptidase I n=1 Tax=Neisseria weixii TaxID=1853276 RepID=UPI000BB94109|nr:signal peptidase I [Neisseria weixii]ATD64913.1 signal peptidase I [Neisseria weixii]
MMKVDSKEYFKNLYIVFSLRYASIFLLLVVIFLAWSKYFGFAVNASHSLPHKLYLIQKSRNHLADLKQGDYVAYAWQGEFYPVGTQMVKRVAGLPGDTVSRSGREFFVNGTAVGRAKEFSLKGAPLEASSFEGSIPKRFMWVAADHQDSLDSRYEIAGLIHSGQIIGKAIPIF